MKTFGLGKKKRRLGEMFWTENVCTISVCLTEKQLPFYLVAGGSLSVSKARNLSWSETGLFVKIYDWREINVKYSEKLGAFMFECRQEIEVESIVTPID